MNVNDWKQNGNVYLWRYEGSPKNYPGWHLTADSEGAIAFITLIDLVSGASSGTKRTIVLSKPGESELRVPGCRQAAIAAEKLVLESAVEDASFWSVKTENRSLALRAGKANLAELRKGIGIQNRGVTKQRGQVSKSQI